MTHLSHSAGVVLLGFVLLLLQSALGSIVPSFPFTPNLLLPIVIALGVATEVHVVRGAALAFFIGYLQDLFCGNILSLHTFVLVATFMLSRGAGLRLVHRGPGSQMLLTFAVALVVGGAALALRAIFERPAPFPAKDVLETAAFLTAPAIATAVTAPLVFAANQRVDVFAGRRREEAAP